MTYLRQRRTPVRLAVTVLLIGAAGFIWLREATHASASPRDTHGSSVTTIGSRHTKDGVILVGPRGQTLYLFVSRGRNHQDSCYRRCARNWRPLRASGRVLAAPGSGVKQRWLSTTRRRDGIVQVTYDHFPLYVDVGETQPGNLKGDGAHEFGGKWYAVPISGVKSTCVGHC